MSFLAAVVLAACFQTTVLGQLFPLLERLERRTQCSPSVLKDPSARLCSSDRSLSVRNGSFLLMGDESRLEVEVRSALSIDTLSVLSLGNRCRLQVGDGSGGGDSVLHPSDMSHVTLDNDSPWLISDQSYIFSSRSRINVKGPWSIAINGNLRADQSKIQINDLGSVTFGPRSRIRLDESRWIVAQPHAIRTWYREPATNVTIGASNKISLGPGSSMLLMRGNFTTAAESEIQLGAASMLRVVGSLHVAAEGRLTLGRQAALFVGPEIGDEFLPGVEYSKLIFGKPNQSLEIGPGSMLAIRTSVYCSMIDSMSIFDTKLIIDSRTDTAGLNITCFDESEKLDTFLAKIKA